MNIYDMNDPWGWWRAKLIGLPVQLNPSTPHAGFYRMASKAYYGARRTFKPVAYWPDNNGDLRCRIGDDDVSPERGQGIWESVGNHPVSEEAYRAVAQDGGLWPDEHELVPMGDNLPPEDEDNSFEGLRDKLENLAREANARIDGPPIETQAEADQIGNLADRLTELAKRVDEARATEKRPHDEAAKAIQRKWAPLLTLAETYKNLKYKLILPWLAKLKRQAEEAAAAAAAMGERAEAKRPRAGTRGRAITLKTLQRAEITDYPAALAYFADSPDVKDLIQHLANRAVRAGITPAGTKIVEETQAV